MTRPSSTPSEPVHNRSGNQARTFLSMFALASVTTLALLSVITAFRGESPDPIVGGFAVFFFTVLFQLLLISLAYYYPDFLPN